MTLLKDPISIPECVHQGDFVLKRSEGVTHAEATLRDYVVTPHMVRSVRTSGFTLDDLRAWKPLPTVAKRGKRKVNA